MGVFNGNSIYNDGGTGGGVSVVSPLIGDGTPENPLTVDENEILNKIKETETFSFEINPRISSNFSANYLTLSRSAIGIYRLYGLLTLNNNFTMTYDPSDLYNIATLWSYLGRFKTDVDYVGQPFNNFTNSTGNKTAYFTAVRMDSREIAVFVSTGDTLTSGDNIPLNTVFV